MKKPGYPILDELAKITTEVSGGLLSLIVPLPRKKKAEWCNCPTCGGWHFKAGKK
jgi:hypothetical protein